jgi:D-aminopeptidase
VNILIAADMEGIAGIDDYGDCLPSHPSAYARGRQLMTDEVLAAIEALRVAGAERISVGDWHMVGTNIERERMPEGIEVRPIADLALDEAEPSMTKANGGPLDAVVMLGRGAGLRAGPGRRGDTGSCRLRRPLDARRARRGRAGQRQAGGGKGGLGRAGARSRDVADVRAELAAAIEAAANGPLQPPPARDYPAELRVTAEGEELARTTVAEPSSLLPAIATVFRSSQVSREYRQLAKLLPAGHDSRARALRRSLGSILATPVMRRKERRWLAAANA